ncbi:MAG TPA: hypothetical protein VF240_07850 [Pyrinomonadaceae bacterium]
MRLRHTLAAAPLLTACLLAGASSAHAQSAAQPEHALKVAAEIVEQKYCVGAGGVDFLHTRLLLRYANAGSRRLIVYRGGNLFYQVVVYPAEEGPPRYELRTTSARYATREPEPLDTPRPNVDFVSLAPGGEFRTEVSVTLPVTPAGVARVPNTVGVGKHSLWLRVSTWYESKPLGDKLRERWARTGHLWTTPVSTAALRFDTERLRSTRACPGASATDVKRD